MWPFRELQMDLVSVVASWGLQDLFRVLAPFLLSFSVSAVSLVRWLTKRQSTKRMIAYQIACVCACMITAVALYGVALSDMVLAALFIALVWRTGAKAVRRIRRATSGARAATGDLT